MPSCCAELRVGFASCSVPFLHFSLRFTTFTTVLDAQLYERDSGSGFVLCYCLNDSRDA